MEEIFEHSEELLCVLCLKVYHSFPVLKNPLSRSPVWGLYLSGHIWPLGTQRVNQLFNNWPNYNLTFVYVTQSTLKSTNLIIVSLGTDNIRAQTRISAFFREKYIFFHGNYVNLYALREQ